MYVSGSQCTFLHVKAKCEELGSNIEELESECTEMAANNKELKEQCNKDIKEFQLLKVLSPAILIVCNHSYLHQLCITILLLSLPKQEECDGRGVRIHELETSLHERIDDNAEFERHLGEEAARCHEIQVISNSTTYRTCIINIVHYTITYQTAR